MSARLSPSATAPAGPGRPKDLAKRAAILDAAREMFRLHGFDGASMEQIATEAGVSKLTVYSHFGDKSALFATVVRTYCEQSLPPALFEPSPGTPLRERLLDIARAFFAMCTSPEAIAGHRVMCSPKVNASPLPQLFWEAGPQSVQGAFAQLLERRNAAGELAVPDVPRAASQFFALVKGDLHARLVLGQCNELLPEGIEEHIQASVDMFLRAYAVDAGPQPGGAA